MKPRAAVSWSGGKDSYLALHRSASQFDVVATITMFDDAGARSRSHGLRPEIIDAQAARLGLHPVHGHASWSTYEDSYRQALRDVRSMGVTHVIFGDIMYESNRVFPERVSAAEGLIPVEPLWGESTDALYREFIDTGADARIVTVRDGVLDPSWLGRPLTLDLLTELLAAGVDPCGEHGEYHTVVTNAPLFAETLAVDLLDVVCHGGCWAVDLSLSQPSLTVETSHAARK
jgi:diphthine-ammonia ligase